jgi:vacuolar protein sorting-associated protein VTA1
VEEVPDADLRRDAAGVSLPPSPISGGSYRGPSPKPDDELRLPGVPTELGQPAQQASFHSLSQYPSDFQPTPNLPSAPASWTQSRPSPETSPPPTAWSQPPVDPPSASAWPHHQPSPSSNVPPTFSTNLPSTAAVASPPVSPPVDSYYTNMAPTASAPGPARPTITPAGSYAPIAAGGPTVDEAAMVGAQKHAKWAISALNFEDVPTAVRELRRALELLGAT